MEVGDAEIGLNFMLDNSLEGGSVCAGSLSELGHSGRYMLGKFRDAGRTSSELAECVSEAFDQVTEFS